MAPTNLGPRSLHVISKALDQYSVDAQLHAAFEQSCESRKSSDSSPPARTTDQSVCENEISVYLSKIQRGGLIQPHGCLIAVDEESFRVIAYSENAGEMLGLNPQSVPCLEKTELLSVGTDARLLFASPSVAVLEKAFRAREITLSNPILVHSEDSGRSFYAILHRIDVGIVVDLEPAKSQHPALSIAGAVQSQKLAIRAISQLQSLPGGGDIKLLCNTVAECVRELTGYDRVMVYKFHEDEHGEVVAESKKPELEPYQGLHYPATDVPQASRFLFKQDRVRIIVDCHATPVPIVQDDRLSQPLCLVGSTLRASHSCHLQYMKNIGCTAALILAVTINGNKEEAVNQRSSTHLWGLVVCHHSTARCIPFALRYACEFLMQSFGLQLNMELQLASQLQEKRVLRTHTLLCEMLLRDSPAGIVTQSPTIMDLVRCDGAALFYKEKCYLLGVTPTEAQINDIVEWLHSFHGDSTGLSTDSLTDAGYPMAASLGDAVCGMAVAQITSRVLVFWFRSETAKEIKWSGEKHHSEKTDNMVKMYPRSSFEPFLEVVKSRSLPWEKAELDAIHSLQLILRDSSNPINSDDIIHSQALDVGLQEKDDLSAVAREMVRLIETAAVPIFAVDVEGCINGWNPKVAELTGLPVEEATGKSLIRDLVYEEYQENVGRFLYHAMRGMEGKNVEIKLRTFGLELEKRAVFVVVNACSSKDYQNSIVGVCFIGQDITSEKLVMDKFINMQGAYTAILHSLNPMIPPIFTSDENLCCTEWNAAMESLTGWGRGNVVGKLLVGEVFGSICRLKGQGALTRFMIVFHNAIGGQDVEEFPFSFFDRNGKYVQALLASSKRTNVEGETIGAFFFLQIASQELQQALTMQRQHEKNCVLRMKELACICHEISSPLSGLQYVNLLLEASNLTEDQKEFLETSVACQKQISKIIKDVDLEHIQDGSLELDNGEFMLGSILNAVISQVALLLMERKLDLVRDIPEEAKTLAIYGDQARIQQLLADLLVNIVCHAPSSEGWVELHVHPTHKKIYDEPHVHVEFRMVCPGDGLPSELIQDMFHDSRWKTQQGLALSMCRRIFKLMNGQVQYVKQARRCHFLATLLLPVVHGGTTWVQQP